MKLLSMHLDDAPMFGANRVDTGASKGPVKQNRIDLVPMAAGGT
jgi:hypothetical protein